MEVDFIVVDAYSPYTAIVTRPQLHGLGAVSLTLHLKVKYPSRDQIEELVESQSMARQCLVTAIMHKPEVKSSAFIKGGSQQSRVLVLSMDAVSEEVKCERLEEIAIDGDPEKFFQVGAQLPPREKEELLAFLMRNINVFAWNAYEALMVDPNFISHHLNVNPAVLLKKQPPQHSSKEHYDVVKKELNELKQSKAIKEVFYPEWLANTMVVKKKNGKWWVCVDFTHLNKSCPKDPFPMPWIDQLMDVTVGHPQMSFLDAFQGYLLCALGEINLFTQS